METEEQRSTQRWQRLQRAAAMEDLVVVPAAELDDDSWDRRPQHHADAGAAAGGDDDDLETRRDPMVKGWRWLKAVSMVVFTARPNKTTTTKEMEPLYPPQEPRSDDQSRMAAREAEIRLRSPHRRTHEVDVSKLNTGPWLNSPQRRTPTAQVQPSLPPQQPAEFGSKSSVPEVVMDVASPKTAQVGAVHSNSDDDKEQRGRCLKYSQKALGFAVCTFIGYAGNASTNTAFKMAIAPFFLAICADLLSLKTKAKLGSALVYFSSLHLLLMTYLIFIAFDMDHAYAILFLPLVVFASHLQQKLWPPKSPPPGPDAQAAQQSADERSKAASKELDSIFELSSLILNWSSFVSAIMTVVRHFITAAGKDNDEIAPGAVGLLFFLTIILGIYLMLASTVRNPALNLPTKYLDVVLICLLLSTLIATVMTFRELTSSSIKTIGEYCQQLTSLDLRILNRMCDSAMRHFVVVGFKGMHSVVQTGRKISPRLPADQARRGFVTSAGTAAEDHADQVEKGASLNDGPRDSKRASKPNKRYIGPDWA